MARPCAPLPLPSAWALPAAFETCRRKPYISDLLPSRRGLTHKHSDPGTCVPRKDPESEGVAVGAAHTECERKGGGEADTAQRCSPHLRRLLKMPPAVASQGRVPLGSRKQDSWALVSDSEHPSPAPTPGPHSRGLCQRRGTWLDPDGAHLGGTRAARISAAGGQASPSPPLSRA